MSCKTRPFSPAWKIDSDFDLALSRSDRENRARLSRSASGLNRNTVLHDIDKVLLNLFQGNLPLILSLKYAKL